MRILNFEADKKQTDVLSNILSDLGHELVTANSSDSGFKFLENQKFDLIFLSAEMPDRNGYLVCKDLKEKNIYQAIPLILSSSDKKADLYFKKHEKLPVRADNYLKKPYIKEDVLAVLAKYVKDDSSGYNKQKIADLEEDLRKQKMVYKLMMKELKKAQDECKSLQAKLGVVDVNQTETLPKDQANKLKPEVEEISNLDDLVAKVDEGKQEKVDDWFADDHEDKKDDWNLDMNSPEDKSNDDWNEKEPAKEPSKEEDEWKDEEW